MRRFLSMVNLMFFICVLIFFGICFNNESIGGFVPDITYTGADHSASRKARIVKIDENATYFFRRIPDTGQRKTEDLKIAYRIPG